MRLLTLLFLLSLTLTSTAQKGNIYTITLNNKIIVTKTAWPPTAVPKATVAKASLKKINALTVNIADTNAQKDWHKIFIITNENGEEIMRDEQKTNVGAFTLNLPIATNYSVYNIAVISTPNDANQAAVMRLRTIPIAAITIK